MPCLWVTRQFSLLSVLALACCALGGLFFPCCLTQVSWGRLPYALWRPEIPWKDLSALLVTAASRSWNLSPLDEFLSTFQFHPLHSVCYPQHLVKTHGAEMTDRWRLACGGDPQDSDSSPCLHAVVKAGLLSPYLPPSMAHSSSSFCPARNNSHGSLLSYESFIHFYSLVHLGLFAS